MASELTHNGANVLLDYLFHGMGASTVIWLALSTTTPDSDGSNVTEPVGNNYGRCETDDDNLAWDDAAAGLTENKEVFTFATPSGSWGTVTYVVAYDAETVGNTLWYAELTASAAINADDVVRFPVDSITARMSAAV